MERLDFLKTPLPYHYQNHHCLKLELLAAGLYRLALGQYVPSWGIHGETFSVYNDPHAPLPESYKVLLQQRIFSMPQLANMASDVIKEEAANPLLTATVEKTLHDLARMKQLFEVMNTKFLISAFGEWYVRNAEIVVYACLIDRQTQNGIFVGETTLTKLESYT